MIKALFVTDLHYTPDLTSGNRKCSLSLEKMDRIRPLIENAQLKIHLGDLINGTGNHDKDLKAMNTARQYLDSIGNGHFYHVMGNHDSFALNKNEITDVDPDIGTAYTFQADTGCGMVDFIVIDSCFHSDETPYSPKKVDWTDSFVPRKQIDWLEEKLCRSDGAVILIHQNLDKRYNNGVWDPHVVRNCDEVRKVIEDSHKVRYVFQGHYHPGRRCSINGTEYITIPAVCEGNGIPWCSCRIFLYDSIDIETGTDTL